MSLSACGGSVRARESADAGVDGSADASAEAPPPEALAAAAVVGQVDTAFGGGTGLVGGPLAWAPAAVTAAPDGTLIVVGFSVDDADPPLELVRRFTPAGVPDATFGTAGQALAGVNPAPHAQTVALLPDGMVAALGASNEMTGTTSFLARWTTAGVADDTFARDGTLIANAAGQATVGLFAADASAIVLGSQGIVRILADGQLDDTFGGGQALPPASAAALAGCGKTPRMGSTAA
jgi:hypothetical protein